MGETLGIWIAAGLTLMMFSFIYRDNVLFKIGEHLYLGLSVGYFINVQYWNTFYPEVFSRIVYDHNYVVIVPAVLGFFLLLRLVPSLSWLSRWSFAFYIGGFAGLAVPFVLNGLLLPQLTSTLVPFQPATSAAANLANINQVIILVAVFSVLIFFFFSLEHKKLVGSVSKVGLFFLMLGFGAAFGTTVMARVSLLVGRFQFLIEDWLMGRIFRAG
ncbi:hypothetical protein IT575_11610 [bacterium]|nr:hypothetical protein [bacterium]